MKSLNEKINEIVAMKESMEIDDYIKKLKELKEEILIELKYDLNPLLKLNNENALIIEANRIINS